MNIDAEINVYISRLSDGEKFLLLDLMKKINYPTSDFSIAEKILAYNNELEKAVQLIKNGDFIEHEDVLKESNDW